MAKDNAKDKNNKIEEEPQAPPKGIVEIAKGTFGEFMEDNCLNLAAAVTYYALQSIIPLIIGFVAIGTLFLKDQQTRDNFVNGIKSVIPTGLGNLNEVIDGLIAGAGTVGTLAILTALWTGSGIFDQFIFAINQAYDVEKDKRNFFVKLGLRIALLFGLGLLLAIAFSITIVLQILFNGNKGILGIFSFILPILSYAIPYVLEVAIFAILYKFSPARDGVRWKPAIIGAAVAGVLFELLKIGFTLYVTVFGAASSAAKTYGALGGIVVFLFYIYLSAAVILLGAELSALLHNFRSGMASVEKPGAVVEAPAKTTASGAVVPQGRAGAGAGAGMYANSQQKQDDDFDYGTAEKPAPANAVFTSAPGALNFDQVQSEKSNPLAIITGTVVLILAALASAVTRRKNPA